MDYWAVNNIYYYPGAVLHQNSDGSNSKYFSLSDRDIYYDAYSVLDPSTDNYIEYGKCNGLLRRNLAGGNYTLGSPSGSRHSNPTNLLSAVSNAITVRGCNKR